MEDKKVYVVEIEYVDEYEWAEDCSRSNKVLAICSDPAKAKKRCEELIRAKCGDDIEELENGYYNGPGDYVTENGLSYLKFGEHTWVTYKEMPLE